MCARSWWLATFAGLHCGAGINQAVTDEIAVITSTVVWIGYGDVLWPVGFGRNDPGSTTEYNRCVSWSDIESLNGTPCGGVKEVRAVFALHLTKVAISDKVSFGVGYPFLGAVANGLQAVYLLGEVVR